MSEEKSSPNGIIVVVAVIAVVAAFFVGKSAGGNGDQTAGNQQQPTNGSDTNKTTPPPEPPKPEKPAEPTEPAFVKEGLVAYYPFNGNAKDESGNGNDLTSKGTTLTKDRHGNADSAYAFDGSTYMEAPNDVSMQLTEFTVSFWIDPIEWTKNTALLMKDGHASGQNYGMWLNPEGGSPRHPTFQIYSAKRKPGGGYFGIGIKSPKPVSMNAYSMLTGTFSDKELLLYVNGLLVASQKTEMVPGVGNQPLFLGYDGGFQNGRYNKFKGTMDDVRIYSRALSEEQVTALYDWEKPKE